MAHKKILLFALTFLMNLAQGFSQGGIISVMPGSGYASQQQDVVIQGLGTDFKKNITQVSFGDGIQVLSVNVNTAENLVAKINILPNANAGSYNITITTNGTQIEKPAAYTVFASGGTLSAQLDVLPVQSLHLSDFDPNSISTAPLLFTVTVYNDMQERNLKAVLTVSGEQNGKLGGATKILSKTQPGAVIRFNNRQFDSYNLNGASRDLIEDATKTGLLPADIYTYHLELFDGKTKVAEAEGKNIISNTQQRPELISPGVPFGNPAGNSTFSRQPLFQWFGQANSYDIAIYKVQPNQNTEQEVVLNRPIYTQKDISGSSLLYPASAEQLIPNQLYAWQIKGNYNGANGKEQLASAVFWFKITTDATPDATAKELKIIQEDMNLPLGETTKFSTKAYNANEQEIQVKPTWRVIPADGGTITKDGVFTAGTKPMSVAILASYGDLQDYITVSIVSPPMESMLMDGFLRKIFGIPAK
jgi:hypothetical protein